ncbi:hypothetical protein F4804DRAFT_335709 [Jackrogersella minutella]|nr:hypothetical protein F4804DRAFT_335709 [Jackrogersella minutella]
MPSREPGRAQNAGKGTGKRTSAPEPRSHTISKQLSEPSSPRTKKHAALKGNPVTPVSREQWENINQAIEKTVDLVLCKNITLDSFGPDYWEMDEGLGIALVAEIRRTIKEICCLNEPKLQKELRKMARDVTHKEFRVSYKGGGVWFWFRMTNLQKATQPMAPQESDALMKTVGLAHDTTDEKMNQPT